MAVERVIDLEHQRYADIPSTSEGLPGRGAEEQQQDERRRRALKRLRVRAGCDFMLADLLTVLGLDE